jgi:uncharacterized OB-fold protein
VEEQVIYHPDFLVIPEGGEKPYLVAYRCEKCGMLYFPKVNICLNCFSEDFAKQPLSGKGKVYSYTIQYTPQPGLKAPLTVGYIDLPEDLRVLAQIIAEPEQMKIGMDVEVTVGEIRKDADGKPMISYKFKPVE